MSPLQIEIWALFAPVLLTILGFVLGSFVACTLSRWPRQWSIRAIPSICFSCHKQLQWFELIPFFSFLIQRGKCRNCGAKIGWHTWLIETTGGGLGVLFWLTFGNGFTAFVALAMMACLSLVFGLLWQRCQPPWLLLLISLILLIILVDLTHLHLVF